MYQNFEIFCLAETHQFTIFRFLKEKRWADINGHLIFMKQDYEN